MRFRAVFLNCCLLAFSVLITQQSAAQTQSQPDWFCPISASDIFARLFDSERNLKADSAAFSQPPFEELTEAQLVYLSKVLDVWQERSSKANKYELCFKLEIFDAAANCGGYPAIKEVGYLRFTQPNKWLYRIDNVKNFSGIDHSPQPRYVESRNLDHRSLCYFNGGSLKVLDRINRRCLAIPLADESSAPRKTTNQFPFAVDKQELQTRFWMRPIANPTDDMNLWVELWPRLKLDQRNFSRLQVALDNKSAFPKKMTVFMANWRPGYENREVYDFSEVISSRESTIVPASQ